MVQILSVDGGEAVLEAGRLDGLRPGDVGKVFYGLSVGGETKRIEVGTATVTEVEDSSARCAVPAGKTRPGFLIAFELPAERTSPDTLLHLARERLAEETEAGTAEELRLWIDRLIPEDPRVEAEVIRLLEARRRPAKAEPEPVEGETPAEPEMIAVSGGSYLIGLDVTEARFYSQQPRFRLQLDAFRIDARPVSKREFLAFRGDLVFPELDQREAATGLTYAEADAFCRWRGLELPTEFQWEVAIGSAGAEPGELEWTSSWYQPYPGNTFDEPEYGERYRVIRGDIGGEGFDHRRRRFALPATRNPFLGFRCAGPPADADRIRPTPEADRRDGSS